MILYRCGAFVRPGYYLSVVPNPYHATKFLSVAYKSWHKISQQTYRTMMDRPITYTGQRKCLFHSNGQVLAKCGRMVRNCHICATYQICTAFKIVTTARYCPPWMNDTDLTQSSNTSTSHSRSMTPVLKSHRYAGSSIAPARMLFKSQSTSFR